MPTAVFGLAPKAAGWIASRTAKSLPSSLPTDSPARTSPPFIWTRRACFGWEPLGNGLIRFQSGRWINYTTDNGLNGNGVDYIIEDDQGCLWIGSNAGLMRVKKSDLNAFAAGTLDFIPCHSYGERDGLPSDECTLGSQPAACRAADGTLWFPTIAGLVPIDPAQIQTQTNALPVLIESVLIEGQEQGANGPHGQPPQSVVVPAGKELLEIRYTGLNLDDPQQVRRGRHTLPHIVLGWQVARSVPVQDEHQAVLAGGDIESGHDVGGQVGHQPILL